MREVGEVQMQYILSLSYGKDSLACLGAIEELGWALDRIVHIEIWATETIQADPPPMVEFKAKADAIIKARWGIEVEHIKGPHTAEQRMYRLRVRGDRRGEMVGWPRTRGCEIQSSCKRDPYEKAIRNAKTYLGIAADEPSRMSRHRARGGIILPLVESGWTEAYCRQWCEENDLLSPIYTTAARNGCWFCPQQGIGQLRILRKMYPEYWALMMKWDAESPMKFKADGHTVHDFERRFQLEDLGLIPTDRKFRWDMCNQVNLFELMEEADNFA